MLHSILAKELFGVVALCLTLLASTLYIQSILTRTISPHVFSWIIWGAGTLVVFTAQLLDGGAYGAWVIGVSGILTLLIAGLAWRVSNNINIHRNDYWFLGLAASAFPLWFFTQSPLLAVVTLTIVDLLGFGPSIRKAYQSPHEESALFFALNAARNGFVLLALGHYSWTTVLFPAAVGAACTALFMLIVLRRGLLSYRADKTCT